MRNAKSGSSYQSSTNPAEPNWLHYCCCLIHPNSQIHRSVTNSDSALRGVCRGGGEGGGADLHKEGLFQLQQAGALGGCSLHYLHMAPHLL